MQSNKRRCPYIDDEATEKGKEKEKLMLSDDEIADFSSEGEDTLGESAVEEAPPPPKKRYRLNSKTLYLTYPKCPITVEETLAYLEVKLGEIQEYIIARELHQVLPSASTQPTCNHFLTKRKKMLSVNGGNKHILLTLKLEINN